MRITLRAALIGSSCGRRNPRLGMRRHLRHLFEYRRSRLLVLPGLHLGHGSRLLRALLSGQRGEPRCELILSGNARGRRALGGRRVSIPGRIELPPSPRPASFLTR